HLVPFRIFAASEPDMEGVRVFAGEFEEKETVRRVLPIVGDCVAEYLRHTPDEKFICFAVNTAHAQEIQRQFMAAGVVCELFTYRETPEERDRIMREFRGPDSYIRGLISVSALQRGLDVPDIGTVIVARPLRKSVAELVQSIGRGLRPAAGKTQATILDHAGNTVRLWGPLMEMFEYGVTELDDGRPKHREQRKPKQPEPMKCPSCHAVHRRYPVCPSCGHEYRRTSNVEHQPGELVEVGGT